MLKEKRLQKESWRIDRNKISSLNERRGSLSSRSIVCLFLNFKIS